MKLYSLRRGFLHRAHCRRLSPLSTRMRSPRRELLFGRCANETSSWIRPLVLQPTMLDLGSARAGKRSLLASTSPADRRILTQRLRLGENYLPSAKSPRRDNYLTSWIRVTGSQLHAARVLVGLSREDLAERAGLCRHSICKWETSSV